MTGALGNMAHKPAGSQGTSFPNGALLGDAELMLSWGGALSCSWECVAPVLCRGAPTTQNLLYAPPDSCVCVCVSVALCWQGGISCLS